MYAIPRFSMENVINHKIANRKLDQSQDFLYKNRSITRLFIRNMCNHKIFYGNRYQSLYQLQDPS